MREPVRQAGERSDPRGLHRRQPAGQTDLCLAQINRALKTISECDQALIRATDETELLNQICRIVVDDGGYRLAWVGFAEDDEAKSVRPVAQHGFEEGYLETVNITWADTQRGRGPVGTAIRTGQPCAVQNILEDPRFLPWRDEARQRGYAACVGLPLTVEGRVFGALNIYAARPDAFNAEETKLLTELADDLAYGVSALRVREERNRAEEEIRQRNRELTAVGQILTAAVTQLDLPTVLDHALQGAMALTGLEGGTLCLVNPDRQSLELAAQINTSPETIRDLTTNVIRIGDCLCGECARTCQPLILWDNASGSEFATREATRNEGIRFHGAFPLLVQDRCIGVLCVFARNEARPSERSLQLVQDLCGPIALAIENARLFKAVQQELAARKRAEGALRESEEKFRGVFNNAQVGMFRTRLDGSEVPDVNEKLLEVFGATREEMLGLPSVIHWADPQERQEALDRLKTQGQVTDFECRMLNKRGEVMTCLLSLRLYREQGILEGSIRDITDLKQAEEALKESERKVSETLEFNRKILNTSSIAILTFRESGQCTFANEAAAKMGGTEVASILAQNFHQVESWKKSGMYEAALEALGTGAEQHLETHHTTTWGKDVWFNLQFCRFHCGGEKQLLVFTQDVTERKHAEEALRASEERFKVIATNTPDHLLVQDVDLRYLWVVNPQLGLTEEDMIGKTDFDLLGAEEAEKLTQIKREVLASGQPVHVELPVARDGNVEYFDGSYVPKHGPDGKLDGLIGYFRNVTERKRAEEALRESEERFRAAFEEGAVAMALAALDSTLLKVNTSFCRMLGFSASELVGRPFTEITHPDDLPVNLIGIQRLACGEVSSFRMEKRYIRKDGTVLWADMSTASVRDAQGRPLYLVTHVHDVTDRKQAEEALRRLNERLELQVAQRTEDLRHTVGRLQQLTLEISQAEDRERRRIADLLHDDVQQTLAAAKFHLNLLSSEARSPEESQEIVEQVKQMLKEAIEKSRSLSHELSPVLYQVDLTEVLNWLARHMQHRHGLIVHVEACGPVDSSSEPMKAFLYRVAQELLFNVVKHADVGEARIRVRRMGRCICLSVVDRGRGFDSQRVEEAAGFGLRTIQERVQLLGGRMKIKSTRGTGTRLLIAVPDEGPPQVAAPTELGDGWVQTENLQRDQPDGASRKHGHSASLGP